VPIQTTELNTIPQTSSPTSPARKTRNDHTNVDILSPTPVSAQTPAVLFDFNSGKVEDEFFHNIDLESGANSVNSQGELSSTHPIQPIEEEQEDVAEQDINPMVARDEDIGDSSRDELAGPISHEGRSPVWTPSQVEKGPHSHYMAKSVEEVHVEELEDVENDFEPVDNDDDGNDSDQSTTESTPPFNYSLRRDSDVESQTDFPVASAMYYEQEPSGFEQQDHLPADDLDLPVSAGTLSSYEKIADDHSDNPWGSTGNLLGGVPPRSKDDRRPSEDRIEPVEFQNKDALTVNETGTNEAVGLDCKEKDIAAANTDVSLAIGADALLEEPTPSLTIQVESSGADRDEDENEDEDGSSPRSTGTTTTPTAMTAVVEGGMSEGGDTEKKRSKKKNKKKGGKKGK
jgi:hypothetical protein